MLYFSMESGILNNIKTKIMLMYITSEKLRLLSRFDARNTDC